jgi:hypothetical protein
VLSGVHEDLQFCMFGNLITPHRTGQREAIEYLVRSIRAMSPAGKGEAA